MPFNTQSLMCVLKIYLNTSNFCALKNCLLPNCEESMFKKEPQIKALSNLKNSEIKKLLSTCRLQRASDSYSFPTQVVKQTTFKTPLTTGTVYTDENGNPIWFKEKFSDLLFPTVYTCWENRDILPVVLAHEHVVEEKLLGGANLMLPGMVPPFDSRSIKTAMVGVASTKSPNVIKAIGIVQLDLPSYSRVIGESGVAVEIIHHYEDGLCKALKVKIEPPENDQICGSTNEEDSSIEDAPIINNTVQEPLVDLNDISEELSQLTVEEVDHFFTRSLYYTLTQDERLELPIDASKFVSNYILRNLPPVNHELVNMKKTSWKKSAKFLKHFEKEGFLKLKGKGDDLVVVGFNKDKEDLKRFVPYRIGQNNGGEKTKPAESKPDMMSAISFYKPISSSKDFMKITELPPNKLFIQPEIKLALDSYISKKNLVNPEDKSTILLDDLLFTMVNRSSKKEFSRRIIARAQVLKPFISNNFTEHFQVLKPDNTFLFKHPLKGSIPQIHIVTEMKIGRKVITRVSNFEKFNIDADDVASLLRKRCSGSTTIGETTTAPKTVEVTVQGPHGPTVISLMNEFGVPTKWINFTNKLKKNKRR